MLRVSCDVEYGEDGKKKRVASRRPAIRIDKISVAASIEYRNVSVSTSYRHLFFLLYDEMSCFRLNSHFELAVQILRPLLLAMPETNETSWPSNNQV